MPTCSGAELSAAGGKRLCSRLANWVHKALLLVDGTISGRSNRLFDAVLPLFASCSGSIKILVRMTANLLIAAPLNGPAGAPSFIPWITSLRRSASSFANITFDARFCSREGGVRQEHSHRDGGQSLNRRQLSPASNLPAAALRRGKT